MTIAHVLVSKYADHVPLYGQAQIRAVRASISTAPRLRIGWVGQLSNCGRFDAWIADLKRSAKLFMDEIRAPVLGWSRFP
ncbi:IS66 family transposase [Rhizobium laguerreae]|uniref:IS66 family transposase n=1 Tax=Rhizobium laguerreae TaxID=1076926 RepID=UPI0035E42E49